MIKKLNSYKFTFLIIVSFSIFSLRSDIAFAQDKQLTWYSFEEAIEIAKESKKPIMVDVWAPWCGWCKKMREQVYPELNEEISKNFILTRINRDDNSTEKKYKDYLYTPLSLAQKLNVNTVPAIIFLNFEGEYVAHITGYRESKKLREIFEIVIQGT